MPLVLTVPHTRLADLVVPNRLVTEPAVSIRGYRDARDSLIGNEFTLTVQLSRAGNPCESHPADNVLHFSIVEPDFDLSMTLSQEA